nr:hypothetical protein [Sphingomonas melonis]
MIPSPLVGEGGTRSRRLREGEGAVHRRAALLLSRDNRSDRGHDAFEVPHHIGIGEADHVIAFVLEEAGAGGVAFDFGGMVVAVDFDD